MCYHLHANFKNQLKRARDSGLLKKLENLKQSVPQQEDQFHVSGFTHPKLLVYANSAPFTPTPMTWGLTPHWVKSEQDKLSLWNSTLNCRGESMFEKPSFKDSASEKRCLIYIDGFFEFHHYAGKKYPYYVHLKNKNPICLGGLWSEWLNPQTGEVEKSFTIVTTKGNQLLSDIHNNPQLEGPRMPVILPESKTEAWLNTDLDSKAVEQLMVPFPEDEMNAFTVGPLQGKKYAGNVQEVLKPVKYAQLTQKVEQQSLNLFD